MRRSHRTFIFLSSIVASHLSLSEAYGKSVANKVSETVLCTTLDSAKIAKETRGQLAPPKDCLALAKGSWHAVVLVEGGDFYYLGVPLQDGQYRKVWGLPINCIRIIPRPRVAAILCPGGNIQNSGRAMLERAKALWHYDSHSDSSFHRHIKTRWYGRRNAGGEGCAYHTIPASLSGKRYALDNRMSAIQPSR
jgi:hypothetical protein